jgi:hypothetical protein
VPTIEFPSPDYNIMTYAVSEAVIVLPDTVLPDPDKVIVTTASIELVRVIVPNEFVEPEIVMFTTESDEALIVKLAIMLELPVTIKLMTEFYPPVSSIPPRELFDPITSRRTVELLSAIT